MIKKSQLLEVSVVDDPVDRRCVSFVCENGQKGDQHDYAILDYVMSGLSRPFDSWRTQNTYRLEPKTKHEPIRRNDKCPCGSGKKFKHCCISGEYIQFPHIQVEFDVTPVNTMPGLVMAGERRIKGLLERSTSVESIWAELAPVLTSPLKLDEETKPGEKLKIVGIAASYDT